jgi:hypothetical protein
MCPVGLRQIDQRCPAASRNGRIISDCDFGSSTARCRSVESNLRESRTTLDVNRATAHLELAPCMIASFVPAHGESRAGMVARQLGRTLSEGLGGSVLLADFDSRDLDRRGNPLWGSSQTPRRLDGRTWGAFVAEVDGLDTLDARETHPLNLSRVLDHARQKYSTIVADLTGARETHALEVLRASDAIFVVTDSDDASVAGIREKAEWLRSIDIMDRVGLLLRPTPGGKCADEIEELTGLPICSLIETRAQVDQLALWLAANTPTAEADPSYAMAG